MRCAIGLLLLCPCVLAQSPPAQDAATLGRVEGRVLDSVSGEPLRKTQLILHGGPSGDFNATSDASGHFVIERVAPGSYSLTAQHQNYSSLDYGSTRPGVPGKRLAVAAGQSVTGVELKLIPFGVISGKVVDQDGDPVTGVTITVMRWGFTRGGRQLMPSGGGASSNDRGEYRVYNLPAGRYFLVARPLRNEMTGVPLDSARRGVVRGEPPKESFGVTFYPSTPDATTASPVIVSPGQEVPGIDIQLRKTRIYTVQGKVTGLSRGRRCSVSMQPQETVSSGNFGMGRGAVVRPDDSSFVFRGVPPGRYILLATVDNRLSARQEVTIGDGDLEGLVVPITDPGAVKGKVQVEGGGSKAPALKGIRVSLTPVDGTPMNLPNANTADDGSFSLDDVPADRYKVNCSPLDSAYLKTIRWSGQVSNDGIVEMAGGGSATLELIFARTTAAVEGDVKSADDQPAPSIPVLLAPLSGRESDFRIGMTDQTGHFSMKGMAPGSYAALATDTQIFGMPDAGLLKALEKITTPVVVEENGHATVSLKIVPEAAIDAAQ